VSPSPTPFCPRFRGCRLHVSPHLLRIAPMRGAMAIVVCLIGAACAAPSQTPQPATIPEPSVLETASQMTSQPPATTALAKPAILQPTVLSGLTRDQVSRLMGTPHFRRVDDPAALWQYRTKGCVLDLYLRADGPVYRVVHFEFRADPKTLSKGQFTPVDVSACFARLAKPPKDARG
jgi:hypothetical protein